MKGEKKLKVFVYHKIRLKYLFALTKQVEWQPGHIKLI